MKNKTPLYSAPTWEDDDAYFSYYEATKANQESFQTDVLKKNAGSEKLPHKLADAAHAHAAQFFTEVRHAFKTDCDKGCAHCCYQPATAFAFEAIRIAEVLKTTLSKTELDALVEKMQDHVNEFKDASVRKNINNKTACPLLVDEKCSVYENRPLTCRMAHSFSVKKCQQAFLKDRLKVQIPISLELISAMSGIIEAVGEPMFELNSAVLAALADPQAAKKWADGDASVFKNCIRDDTQ